MTSKLILSLAFAGFMAVIFLYLRRKAKDRIFSEDA